MRESAGRHQAFQNTDRQKGMGYCCSQQGAGEEGNLSTALYPQGATLDGKHYTAKQIWIITKIQSHMRMYMAKKKVAMIRHEVYPHGMHDMMNAH